MKRSFVSFLFGKRNFLPKEEIIELVKTSKNYNKSGTENLDSVKVVLIFENSNQKMWLVGTNKRIYKILDDIRKDQPKIGWSVSKERLRGPHNDLLLTVLDYKDDIGQIVFGTRPDKPYFYLKTLFVNIPITKAIRDLVYDDCSAC